MFWLSETLSLFLSLCRIDRWSPEHPCQCLFKRHWMKKDEFVIFLFGHRQITPIVLLLKWPPWHGFACSSGDSYLCRRSRFHLLRLRPSTWGIGRCRASRECDGT